MSLSSVVMPPEISFWKPARRTTLSRSACGSSEASRPPISVAVLPVMVRASACSCESRSASSARISSSLRRWIRLISVESFSSSSAAFFCACWAFLQALLLLLRVGRLGGCALRGLAELLGGLLHGLGLRGVHPGLRLAQVREQAGRRHRVVAQVGDHLGQLGLEVLDLVAKRLLALLRVGGLGGLVVLVRRVLQFAGLLRLGALLAGGQVHLVRRSAADRSSMRSR